MPDRGLPLSLWGIWWNAILLLRPAFSRLRTFMWFVTAVAGLTVRLELLGVTSIVRALNLRPRLYTKLLAACRTEVYSMIANDGFAGANGHRTLDRVQRALLRSLSSLRLAILG